MRLTIIFAFAPAGCSRKYDSLPRTHILICVRVCRCRITKYFPLCVLYNSGEKRDKTILSKKLFPFCILYITIIKYFADYLRNCCIGMFCMSCNNGNFTVVNLMDNRAIHRIHAGQQSPIFLQLLLSSEENHDNNIQFCICSKYKTIDNFFDFNATYILTFTHMWFHIYFPFITFFFFIFFSTTVIVLSLKYCFTFFNISDEKYMRLEDLVLLLMILLSSILSSTRQL